MFKGKGKLSHDLYLLLFEGHLRKYNRIICATAFTLKQPWLFYCSDGHRIPMGGDDTGCYERQACSHVLACLLASLA
jgi:hypothetical protein